MNIPKGYNLVPVEPTEEMQVAGGRDQDFCSTCGYDNGGGDPANTYTDMLAAAPAPPKPICDEAKRIAELERALAGMLFAFDDGVGLDWSEDLLDFARKLTAAKEFKAALKPAEFKCKTCNGTRIVSDGAMYCSSGGIPFECGPIECVKDCPDCSKP